MECMAWAFSSVLISDFLCGGRDYLFLGEFSSNSTLAQTGEILCRMKTDEQQAGCFITCFILLPLALHSILELCILRYYQYLVILVLPVFRVTIIAMVFLILSSIRT